MAAAVAHVLHHAGAEVAPNCVNHALRRLLKVGLPGMRPEVEAAFRGLAIALRQGAVRRMKTFLMGLHCRCIVLVN